MAEAQKGRLQFGAPAVRDPWFISKHFYFQLPSLPTTSLGESGAKLDPPHLIHGQKGTMYLQTGLQEPCSPAGLLGKQLTRA